MFPILCSSLRRVVSPRRLACCVATLTALSSPPTRSQEASPPSLREGDRWVWVQRDGFTNLELSTSTLQVKSVLPDGYEVGWVRPGGPEDRQLTLDLNTRQTVDGVAGESGDFRFPLAVGKQWHSITAYRNPNNNVSGVYDMEREVVGMETRKTPAGEFQTWKIAAKGRWILKSDPNKVAVSDFNRRMEITCWFSTAAKACVAREMRNFAKGHVGNWYRYELTQLELH